MKAAHLDYDDVYQDLAIRPIRCVENFDPDKGTLHAHIYSQLKYELPNCKAPRKLTGIVDAPADFRRHNILSMEVVCGINRYKSPVELWLDKTGQIPAQEAGEAAYWGTQHEALVRAEFSKRTGIEVTKPAVILQSEEHPFMSCHTALTELTRGFNGIH